MNLVEKLNLNLNLELNLNLILNLHQSTRIIARYSTTTLWYRKCRSERRLSRSCRRVAQDTAASHGCRGAPPPG